MRVTWSLFPKAYPELDAAGLAHLIAMVGLETTNVVIRDGYHVGEATLKEDLPRFINAMRQEGVNVTRASTMLSADLLSGPNSPLPILYDNGIREFRMGWFPRATHDVRQALQLARSKMEAVAESCQRYGVKAVYQLHHRTLITNPTAGFQLVAGLDPRWVGIELDPGNQAFEGFEPWDHACSLLQDYVAWVGVKDTRTWQATPRSEEAGKGWFRTFCPINEGVTNWQELVNSLANIRFTGTLVMMPFYDEHDSVLRNAKLKAEVDYLKALVELAGR